MAATSAVFGQRGKRDAALVLREEGERGEGVVELAGWFQAGQGEGEGMTRSGGSARLCRGGSASNLGVRARERQRVAKPRSYGRGRDGARRRRGTRPAASASSAKTGEGERNERVERKRERMTCGDHV